MDTDKNNNNATEDAELAPEAPDADADAQPSEDAAGAPPTIQEPRMPTKKDTSLREFLGKMDDYAPIVRCAPLLRPPPFARSQSPSPPDHC